MIAPLQTRSSTTAVAALLLILGAVLTGCNPQLDPQEFGEVVTVLPPVEGAEKPYPLPKLEEAPKDDEQEQK
jgi:hypothetical protein